VKLAADLPPSLRSAFTDDFAVSDDERRFARSGDADMVTRRLHALADQVGSITFCYTCFC
jgi:hypothetical protein